MIIRFLGENVKTYLDNIHTNVDKLQEKCPHCLKLLHRHGHYFRFITAKGIEYQVPIIRLYCPQCRKSHAVIPHILRPYSQYPQEIREEIIRLIYEKRAKAEIARRYGLSRELIHSWHKGYENRIPPVCCAIQSCFGIVEETKFISWWHYLFKIVTSVKGECTNLLGMANHLAQFSGMKVWV